MTTIESQPETLPKTVTESEELIQSGNNLADAVEWLKMGYMIVLWSNGYGNCYHVKSLTPSKIIYIDVGKMPDLMLEGEWPYYFVTAANAELIDVRDYDLSNLKVHQFRLGY